jgi:hypothetical protein
LGSTGGFKNLVFSILMFFGKKYSESRFHAKLINFLFYSKSFENMKLKAKDKFRGAN